MQSEPVFSGTNVLFGGRTSCRSLTGHSNPCCSSTRKICWEGLEESWSCEGGTGLDRREGTVCSLLRCLALQNQNRTPKLSRNSRGDVYENRLTAVPNAAVLAKFTPSTGVVVNGLNAAMVAEFTGVRMLWF